ncbi:hypothetical protein EVAR_2446_1 [Eumeta japonica]|uniref:Uncharacterized protein n=1 Tax=Eumeta variegata TaxID=151549 RepID=A0A4C1SNN8_EUMVA|nr:hypothetical protein EVAR_2446_1 [Eumeta japonica]
MRPAPDGSADTRYIALPDWPTWTKHVGAVITNSRKQQDRICSLATTVLDSRRLTSKKCGKPGDRYGWGPHWLGSGWQTPLRLYDQSDTDSIYYLSQIQSLAKGCTNTGWLYTPVTSNPD